LAIASAAVCTSSNDDVARVNVISAKHELSLVREKGMTIKEIRQGIHKDAERDLATSKQDKETSPEVSGKLVGRLPDWRGSE
jgi:hypothetical protein